MITGSNDAILNEVGRTRAVFGGGASEMGLRRDTVLGHLVVPPGNVSLVVWIGMTSRD
jgi:hypothetical protein